MRFRTLAAVLAVFALAAVPAYADTVGFHAISNNSGIASSIAPQFTVHVVTIGTDIGFVISNSGPVPAVIADVYFEDSYSLLGSWVSLPADWGTPASPNELPGGDSVGFTEAFSADADPPPSHNGIDAGESGTFVLSLNGGATPADIHEALDSGDIRVGLHVQAIGNTGESDSFVTDGAEPTPEPGTLALLALGLGGLAWTIRRRNI